MGKNFSFGLSNIFSHAWLRKFMNTKACSSNSATLLPNPNSNPKSTPTPKTNHCQPPEENFIEPPRRSVRVRRRPMVELELRPIITKHSAKDDSLEKNCSPKSSTSYGFRVKDRSTSPRLATKKTRSKRTVWSGSKAVVKLSSNPQQDFLKSMLEMVKEKEMNTPEELTELLICYLSLNSDENHDVIFKVFDQIFSNLVGSRL